MVVNQLSKKYIYFVKIWFELDDDLPLGKILHIPDMVLVGSVFQESSKYYPHVCLHEFVYEFSDQL